jgi:hypothetical protein
MDLGSAARMPITASLIELDFVTRLFSALEPYLVVPENIIKGLFYRE